MSQRHHSFSTLLRNPKSVTADLAFDDVVIDRRDGADFIMRPLARDQQERRVIEQMGNLLHHVDRENLVKALNHPSGPYPWIRFLPEGDRALFAQEVVEVLVASADLGRFAALEFVIEQWRHTAEVWADPELAASLSNPVQEPINVSVDRP